MLNTPRMQRSIAQKIIVFVVLATALWICVLIAASVQARNSGPGSEPHNVALGPLVLNQITKTATANGHVVGFSFERGLAWYFIIWTGCGALAGWLTARGAKSDELSNNS